MADVRVAVGRDGDEAKSARVVGDRRRPNPLNEHATLEQERRGLHCASGVSKDDRNDRGVILPDLEALRAEAVTYRVRVFEEFGATVVGLEHEAGGANGCSHDGRCGSSREDIAARAVLQIRDRRGGARDKGAGAAEGLAECPDQQVRHDVVLRAESTAMRTEYAEGMRFVDQQSGIVRVGELAECGKRRGISVHREQRVGDDQRAAVTPAMLGEKRGQVLRVGVAEDVHVGAREPAPVDETRVTESVAEDDILLGKERLDRPEVGGVSGGEERGRRQLNEARKSPFGIEMGIDGAGDQTGSGGTDATRSEGCSSSRAEVGVVG